MLQKLELDEFIELAKKSKRVAVFQEIPSNHLTPISVFEACADKMQDGALLEAAMEQFDTGRYSFLAFDSIAQFRSKGDLITQKIGSEISTHHAEPFTALRQLITQLTCTSRKDMTELTSSIIGFMTYDTVRIFETIPDSHANNDIPDILFNFYRTTLTFDRYEKKLLISFIVEINDDPEKLYHRAQKNISELIKIITSHTSQPLRINSEDEKSTPLAEPDISDIDFMKLIERTKDYIIRGDAFQIVISRCFKQSYVGNPFDIYRVLRHMGPSPYMFYIPLDDQVFIGASPERLISAQHGKIVTNPIAGTRKRRSTDKKSDQAIADELLHDKKELAEHMMLVDLSRNDVGAVSIPGSVKVDELLQVKHYSHVSHIVSVITGKLRDNLDAFDALAAAFPAGTVSGAPKIRAMEIIDELETSRRGLYGGAVCRMDNQGNFDSCIAIRMAVVKNGIATVRAGAGIVFDSNPKLEAQETRNKAKAMLEAIRLAREV